MHQYLDNCIVIADSLPFMLECLRLLIQFCQNLEIVINMYKLVLKPTQRDLYASGCWQTLSERGCAHGEFFCPSTAIYLYTLAISPSLGGSRQHKRTTKTMGTPLRSSSNDEGPSRVWMALLEQHSPSSPVFHNLRRFTDAISPTAPTTGLPL